MRLGENFVLVVPPLINRTQVDTTGDNYVSVYSRNTDSSNETLVRCPLVDWRFISEGACYDFQALAQGVGPKEWQDLTAVLFEKSFRNNKENMIKKCLQHQIDIIGCDGCYPGSFVELLRARIGEIE